MGRGRESHFRCLTKGLNVKTYIVYVKGVEVGYIKAGGHNSAEKKAQVKYAKNGVEPREVSVAYTEL